MKASLIERRQEHGSRDSRRTEGCHSGRLIRYAIALGLNPASFRYALDGRTYEQRVREDFLSGVRSGVNGTPTFFIEGVRYDGPADFDWLLTVLAEVAGEKSR